MTIEGHHDPLTDIDPDVLQPLVQADLDDTAARMLDWRIEPVYRGAARNTLLYRFAGSARSQGRVRPWSIVLKVFRPRPTADDPQRWNYWKREPLVYQSGLLADLPGNLVVPRCLGVMEQPRGEVWLWLEDVADLAQDPWSLDDFGRAARQLGRFNGAYLAGHALPSYPWVSRGRLRAWVALCGEAVAALPQNLLHPRVQGRFSDSTITRLLRLWADRESVLDALDRLPQIFGHLDAFPRNLAVRRAVSGDQLVAIDWASAGFGAVGEELAPLTASSLIFFEADVAMAHELDRIAFTGYIDGLREAGARIDEAMVRFGYTAVAGLRYGLGIALDVGIAADEQQHAWVEQVLGRSVDEMVARDAEVAGFLASLIDETRDLLAARL